MFSSRVLFIIILFFPLIGSAQHEKVSQTNVPIWVQQIEINPTASQEEEEASGFYYLLVDNQDNLETKEYYRRYSYKIHNSQGIQDMSDITIDFDPEYQKVAIHHISIIRNGKRIEKLDLNDLQVVQRESNMENFLYDGRLTIIANLTDVRSGDIVDYAFTQTGENPVYEGVYQSFFFLQHYLPLEHFSYSIYVPADQKINYRVLNKAPEPDVSIHQNFTKYKWENEKISEIAYENNIPAWYDPTPAVQVTQYNTWEEVVRQYEKHYRLSRQERNSIKQQLPKKLQKDPEPEKIIRFVQDEIRYLGFENGLHSQQPRKPAEVLTKRYGDCKDKAFLLSEILKLYNIEAHPMLVHSSEGKNLPTHLASSIVFDHCVVQIELEDGSFKYIDPTISNQGGRLKDIYFPRYAFGLVLKPGEKDLIALPEPEAAQTSIVETFDMDDIGGGAYFDVETIYRGYDADTHRKEFAESNRQSIQKNYTSFYSGLYPSIKAVETLTYKDHRETNEFIVSERYRIDSLWYPSVENQEVIFAEFTPISLNAYLFPESTKERKMPYYINPDVNLKHTTVVYVPEAWPIENENLSYGSEEFLYDYKLRYHNAKLEIEHNYANLSDHVTTSNVSTYFSEHDKIQENLSYSLSYDKSFASLGSSTNISFLSVFLILVSIGAAIFFSFKIYFNYDLPTKVKPPFHKSIGGWLVLLGIGLAVNPFVTTFEFLGTPEFFDPSVWSLLFTSENLGLGILFIFEMIYNSAFIIFSILAAILFFQRRTIAPKVIIIIMISTLSMEIIDTWASLSLFDQGFTQFEQDEMYGAIIKRLISTAIWVPYLIYSQRVEETFTKRLKNKGLDEEAMEIQPTLLP